MRRALALAALGLAALPGTAGATIVPQRGMLGVELGDTVREVRSKLGAPDGIRFQRNEILGRQRLYFYGRTLVAFDGDARNARVIHMSTRSRRERLANGVGVGSTKEEVMRRVASVRCPVDETWHCYIGRFEPGRRVTDFRFGRRGRVSSITVGRVID
ncbi:MAG: hypothetical protein M3389_01330 [Actinomycetota bacterium]|nr:hypothetical protein [Actinomycetota bacterium]